MKVVALSAKTARVSGHHTPPALLDNLKIQVVDPSSGTVFRDVYGKVVERSGEGEPEFRLRFTSLSSEAAAFLSWTLEHGTKRGIGTVSEEGAGADG